MSAISDITAVLDTDPELGERLSREEFEAARTALQARVFTFEPGVWRHDERWTREEHPTIGLLVLDGLMTREIRVAGRPSAEILGVGDVLRPWDHDGDVGMLAVESTWTVTSTLRLAVLDERFLLSACRWPSVIDEITGRMVRRARWLSFRLAMKEIMRVEGRLLVLLWALSERWGVVTPRGVHVRLKLTHEALGKLVGARRPSVTTAIGALTEAGELSRVPDGYLLLGDPPTVLQRVERDGDTALAS